MTKPIRYRLILEARQGAIEPAVRLRKLLKYAGRALGMRCVEAGEVNQEQGSELPSLPLESGP